MNALIRACAVATAAVAWLAGCPACPDTISYLAEEFEDCSGMCDWTTAGEGVAELIETVHPGEHALLMDGPMTATLATPDAYFDVAYAGDEPLVELVTNCPGPLFIEVTQSGGEYDIELTLPTGDQWVWGGDYEVITLPLPQVFFVYGRQWLRSLSIRNIDGLCVVDQIRIYKQRGC